MLKINFLWVGLLLGLVGFVAYEQRPAPKPQSKLKPLNVAFLVYPGVEVLDLGGPMDVFVKASRVTNGSYRCYTVAFTDQPLMTEAGGLRLQPDYTLRNAPAPDVLVLPGGPPAPLQQVLNNTVAMQQLTELVRRAPTVMSVCTGAFLLGGTRALDGHRATTHQLMTDSLARRFPRVTVARHVRYVQDGKLLTTAGVTAGIDGALALVEQHSGRPIADMVCRALEHTRQEESMKLNAAKKPPTASPHKPMTMSAARVAASAQQTTTKAELVTNSAPLASATDPVCHMRVAVTTVHRYAYQGKTYGFCSASCKAVFAAKPSMYLSSAD